MKRLLLALLLLPALAHAQWTRIATEGEPFTVAPDTQVRYGVGERWVTVTASGAGVCTNAFFKQDPAVGIVKTCERRQHCAPRDLGGTGTDALFEFNATGAAVGWWCLRASTPIVYGATWAWLAANPAALQSLPGLKAAADPEAAIAQMAGANATSGAPPGTFAQLQARLAMAKPPTAPPTAPAGTWWVKKAPANASPAGTRPIYRRSSPGTLVQDYGRVPEFAPCDCALDKFPDTAVTPTHCAVNNAKEQLAVCERKP